MGARLPLEELRKIFNDNKVWISIGVVTGTEIGDDRSTCRAKVMLLPDENEIVAKIAWPMVGAESGIIGLPADGDLVLVAYADASDTIEDHAYAFARVNSKEDTFPLSAMTGDMILQALSGKNARLGSDTKATIGRGGAVVESEPVPLGNVLAECLDAIATSIDTAFGDIIAGPIGIGNLGAPVPTNPTLMAALVANKVQLNLDITKYLVVAVTNILSQIAFTER